MPKSKEIEVLERLLKSKNTDDRKFAKIRLAELNTPKPAEFQWAGLCKVIRDGDIDKLPASAFTQANLSELGVDKETAFHVAAEYGCLDRFPSKLLTHRNLMRQSQRFGTVLHHAAAFGHLDQIPQAVLTEKNLLVPNKNDDPEIGFLGQVADIGRATVLHIAALNSRLEQIDKKFLTEKNVLLACASGDTVVHAAAMVGQLNCLPKELLSPRILLSKNIWNGNSALHCAAENDVLKDVPQTLLTEANCMAKNKYDETVFETAREHECLDQLLGMELSESVREIVGNDWFEKNKKILQAKAKLTEAPEHPDVELF